MVVLLFHATNHTGAYGVDVFFCVSGFIMMYITANGEFSLKEFLLKRVFRIVPLYWLVTFLSLFVMTVQSFYGEVVVGEIPFKDLKLICGSLFFYPVLNQFSLDEITLVAKISPIVGAGWTLCYEMLFYLIFGLACKINVKYRAIIASALLILGGAVLAQINSYYDISLFFEFVLGIIAFYLIKAIHSSPKNNRLIYAIFAFVALILMIFSENQKYGDLRGIFEGIPALIFVVSFYGATNGLKIPKLAVVTGNMSFSIYLWHGLVLACSGMGLQLLYKMLGLPWDLRAHIPKSTDELIIAEVAISLIIAYFSYIFIEKRFTFYLRNKFLK